MKSICPYCQNSFIPKRIDALYCCPSHKQMAYKERKLNLPVNLNSLDGLQLNENDAEPSKKLIYPSILEPDKSEKPSINEEDNTHYSSTKIIYPTIKSSKEDQKPSISTPDKTTYPSIDTIQEDKTQQKDQQPQYKHYKSSFVDGLFELTDARDNTSKLADLFWNDTTGNYLWVSTRFKCLVECLLTFSEMRVIELDDLKEICNACTLLIRSNYFKSLPQIYPYTGEILELRQSLRKICLTADANEYLKFRLVSQTKSKLIATRWELLYFVPKVNFGEMNFTA